ncbi:MAG: type II secretion system F family protein [archaeon]
MKTDNVPFSPVPKKLLFNIASHFQGIGSTIAKSIPALESELKQAEIDIRPSIYGAIMFILAIFYFAFGFIVSYIFAQRLAPENAVPLSLLLGFVFLAMVFAQLFFYPKIQVKKKIRSLERNLVFALRTLLIEIRSGVSLFDAIKIIAEGNNGQVSAAFKQAVEKIETGTFQENALEELAENNPSLYFRRTIWQLVNGLKAGADISEIMRALVENLSKEKANQVRRYGNSLRLLSLLYMMLGAIIPALGLTFLIILSSFPQISIDETVFWALLVFIGVGQFMFLGIIKSSRPTLLGD